MVLMHNMKAYICILYIDMYLYEYMHIRIIYIYIYICICSCLVYTSAAQEPLSGLAP